MTQHHIAILPYGILHEPLLPAPALLRLNSTVILHLLCYLSLHDDHDLYIQHYMLHYTILLLCHYISQGIDRTQIRRFDCSIDR